MKVAVVVVVMVVVMMVVRVPSYKMKVAQMMELIVIFCRILRQSRNTVWIRPC